MTGQSSFFQEIAARCDCRAGDRDGMDGPLAGAPSLPFDSIGDANAYYTAAVKSMLPSWRNFFFVAAEPGGSVTVDKPPLGFWIEAAFASILDVSGFSTSLPNILAGVFAIRNGRECQPFPRGWPAE